MTPTKFSVAAFCFLTVSIGAMVQAQACDLAPALNPCKVCHELNHGNPPKSTGPNISDVYGAKAMQSDGFAYSPAIKMAADKGLVWTEENLMGYLADQHGFLTKFNGQELPNKMILITLKDEEKRKNVVAGLKALHECK